MVPWGEEYVFYGGDDSCYCGNSGFLEDENQRRKVKDSPVEEEWDQSVRSECGEGTRLKPCGREEEAADSHYCERDREDLLVSRQLHFR